jgi:dTDP-glucose pyrophosphorylase
MAFSEAPFFFLSQKPKTKTPACTGAGGRLENLTDRARQQDVPMQAQSVSFWLMVDALHCGIDSFCMIA